MSKHHTALPKLVFSWKERGSAGQACLPGEAGSARPRRCRRLEAGVRGGWQPGRAACYFSTRTWVVIQFGSQVLPPSIENDCSNRAEFEVMSDQM